MTVIRELVVQSVGEPYAVKIEKGQKGGYGYEISIKSDSIPNLLAQLKEIKNNVEAICYGANTSALPDGNTTG